MMNTDKHEISPALPLAAPQAESLGLLPSVYRSVEAARRGPLAETRPRNVFIEATNLCNSQCATCPRTFTAFESPKTLGWNEFVRTVEQFPDMERALLHGIGEPLLNQALPQMIAYLKARRVQVLINSNAALLTEAWAYDLIESGLDELRVSLDSVRPEAYRLIRGVPLLPQVMTNVARFIQVQRQQQAGGPRVSLWMMALRENLTDLPGLIRFAAEAGVAEVYLQRLVYNYDDPEAPGWLAAGHAVFGRFDEQVDEMMAEGEVLAQSLGVALRASGATTPRHSLEGQPVARPWAACLRPWTTAYITANGNALPCCLAPFATRRYADLVLGNVHDQNFDEIWNARLYQTWRTRLLSGDPFEPCAGCGVHWSL
jgi:MoaA/NifB/PqqE/SkfB family radical SAM enzyme